LANIWSLEHMAQRAKTEQSSLDPLTQSQKHGKRFDSPN
jgi:hypothetical protein